MSSSPYAQIIRSKTRSQPGKALHINPLLYLEALPKCNEISVLIAFRAAYKFRACVSFGAVESNGGPQSEMMVCTSLPHGERVTGSNSEYCKKKKAPVLGLTKGISQCHYLLGQKTGVTDVKEKPTPTPSFTGNTQTLLDSWNLLSVSRIGDP